MSGQDTSTTSDPTESVDVVVVGAGNAGFCAAHAARATGASVLLIDKAPETEAGGNSFYTAGATRVVHGGAEALRAWLDPASIERLDQTELAPYTADEFRSDLVRLTQGRNDPTMTERLIADSEELPEWMASIGIRWRLMYERQAYRSGDRWVFWGGLALGVVDGGKGLIAQHTEAALRSGIELRHGTACTDLRRDPTGRVVGITVRRPDGTDSAIDAGAVVLTSGGFESSPERRVEHLGAGWAEALVRGTPHNTGEMLDAALALGAARAGDWGSCHSVAWDADAPAGGGERVLTNQLTRQSYPLGIVVNTEGRRFIDEGADFRNYTYAKYGREILAQPGGLAFQLFDSKTRPLLRPEEYQSSPIASATADSLGELAAQLGIDPEGLEQTVRAFNASIVDRPFDPTIKDGRSARVDPPKSNWAQALDSPPFHGFAVRCGITFTFGGLGIDDDARMLDDSGNPIVGLYAAGEIAGGLFSGNYPGGSGLTAGSVFGRRAGAHAGAAVIGGQRGTR